MDGGVNNAQKQKSADEKKGTEEQMGENMH
jgi:hypothetical protein